MSISSVSPIKQATKKLLRVALVGAPNAGKSTLLNRLVLSDISCVSNKVHTTRKNILGVHTEGDTQLEFYDSPGIVTKQHLLRHRLEDTVMNDPHLATGRCDLIAVVVDSSNLRDSLKLNRVILSMLKEHSDKKSFLILNKVDLVKEKRLLLDIGTRLTEGHLEGRCLIGEYQLMKLLNRFGAQNRIDRILTNSPHVIDLNSQRCIFQSKKQNEGLSELTSSGQTNDLVNCETKSNTIGFRNFSQVFSISALHDDGVDKLRDEMINLAQPVAEWPHGPDYLSNQRTKDIVHSIIRGNVMDNVEHEIPYVIRYKYLQCDYDEIDSLHVVLELIAPKKYMIGKLLGKQGAVIFKVTNESREKISTILSCDVKLSITVRSSEK